MSTQAGHGWGVSSSAKQCLCNHISKTKRFLFVVVEMKQPLSDTQNDHHTSRVLASPCVTLSYSRDMHANYNLATLPLAVGLETSWALTRETLCTKLVSWRETKEHTLANVLVCTLRTHVVHSGCCLPSPTHHHSIHRAQQIPDTFTRRAPNACYTRAPTTHTHNHPNIRISLQQVNCKIHIKSQTHRYYQLQKQQYLI